jgi:rubrerythrin
MVAALVFVISPERNYTMEKFGSINEILDFAIKEEEAAAAFYRRLAKKMDKAWMQEIFENFATEEDGHKAKLVMVKQGQLLMPVKDKVLDLKIGDYLVDIDTEEDLDFQNALIVAMKKEKAAFRLYSDLAASSDSADVQDTFTALAQEEAKHKLRFEIEYDDRFLSDN